MGTFKDILDGGFEAHARALPAGGGFAGDRSRAVLRSIHRRRRTRAAATAGGSVLAAGAVAVGALALVPRHLAEPVGGPFITNGLYPWCDLSTFPAVNPGALGATDYQGRLYEDYDKSEFVYVAPDGTRTRLEPDATGAYRFTTPGGRESTFVTSRESTDYMLSVPGVREGIVTDMFLGGVSTFLNPIGPDGPKLGYEWTTVAPGAAPTGLNGQAISEILAESLGYRAGAFDPMMVPKDAVVETVFRWHDGRQLVVEIHNGEFGAEVPDYTDLASVSVRVSNLPDGEVWEITSAYDPSKTWQVACWPYRDGASPSASPSVSPTPSPSLSGWVGPTPSAGVSQGGPSTGPTPSPSYVTPAPPSSADAPLPNSSPTPAP